MELKKGTLLQSGKYKIEGVLGQGSFGITYLATTKFSTTGALGKMDVEAKVAIKEFFMRDVNNRNTDGSTVEGSKGSICANYRKKFRKEAENLARLSHPNIIRVFDVFDENNTSYYVMEYVEGGNLDEYISNCGPIPEDEAIRITEEIGTALAYMHSNKMLHLDMKPKNVMRTTDGHNYRLIDFGLSKQYTDNGEPETSTTIGLGTSGYAPLEQLQYKQDGTFPATLDVYALGATLFKMLTGQRPPEASKLLNEGFPTEILNSYGISKEIIAVVEKAMSPVKKKRYTTINEFIKDFPHLTKNKDEQKVSDEPTIIDIEVPTKPLSIWRDRHWFTNVIIILFSVWIMILFPLIESGIYSWDRFGAYLVTEVYALLCLNVFIHILRNQKKGWYLPLICMPIAKIAYHFLGNWYTETFYACFIPYIAMLLALLIKKKGIFAFSLLGQGTSTDENIKNFTLWRSRNWFTNAFLCFVTFITFAALFVYVINFKYNSNNYTLFGTFVGVCYGFYLVSRNYKIGLAIPPICVISGILMESTKLFYQDYFVFIIISVFYLLVLVTLMIRENGHTALSLMK